MDGNPDLRIITLSVKDPVCRGLRNDCSKRSLSTGRYSQTNGLVNSWHGLPLGLHNFFATWITLLNVVGMGWILSRCGFSICGKAQARLYSGVMCTVRNSLPLKQHLRILRLRNVNGKHISEMSVWTSGNYLGKQRRRYILHANRDRCRSGGWCYGRERYYGKNYGSLPWCICGYHKCVTI